MIAIAPSAAPAISLLDLLTAAGIPAAAPKAGPGSRFHSILQAVSDKSDPPKKKSAKKDGAADNALAIAVPVPPQRTTTPPITLNIFPGNDPPEKNPEKNVGEKSVADSATGEKPVTKKVADAPAPHRPALWVEPRIQRGDQNDAESQPGLDPALAVAASASDGSLSKIEPAFEAHLQPAEPSESTAANPAPAPAAAAGKPDATRPPKDNAPEPADPPAVAAPDAAPSVAQAASSSSKHGDGSHHPAQEGPQEASSHAVRQIAGVEASQIRFDVNAPAPPVASATPSTHAVIRSETTAAPALAPEPKPIAATPTAHDIKLELNSDGQRVEVRLTERAGDIHVAVRTTDASLSGAMRQDLPALTAKLEQSGFRADAWQPGAAAGGERRAVDVAAGSSSQDSQEHPGQHSQQQQDNSQQQNPKNPTNATNRKPDRKDFAWLLQTYR